MKLAITDTNISCAHLVQTADHDSPCRNLHGHNYKIDVTLTGEPAKDGMLIDAKIIKSLINKLDHKFLVPTELITSFRDLKVDRIDRNEIGTPIYTHHEQHLPRSEYFMIAANSNIMILPKCWIYDLPIPSITAEHLAEHLCYEIQRKVESNIRTIEVTVYETDKISATGRIDIPN